MIRKKISRVLLIDDDRATNFLNKLIVEKLNCTENISVAEDGQQALDFIKTGIEDEKLLPNLIFLDINMPIMNGWEFLEVYKKLRFERKKDIKIVMMTASLNPDDKKKASTIDDVTDFRNKPLKTDLLIDILKEYY